MRREREREREREMGEGGYKQIKPAVERGKEVIRLVGVKEKLKDYIIKKKGKEKKVGRGDGGLSVGHKHDIYIDPSLS